MATLRDISAADEAILPQRPRLLAEDPPRRAVVGRWLVRTMAALVLALFGGVVWLAYQETTGGGEPPLIHAEAGPYKRPPEAPGKGAVEAEDWTMASKAFGDHQPAQRPEVILPRQAMGARSIDEADPSLAMPPPEAAKPVVAPPASLDNVIELPPPPGIPAAPGRAQPPTQLAAVEPAAGAPAGNAPKAMPTAPPVQAAVASPPEPRPAAARAPTSAVAAPPAQAPAVVASVAPRPVPPPAERAPPAPTASAGSSGSWAIQLAALSSRDAVDRAWSQMRAQSPAVLGPLSLRVAQIKVSSGNLYRLQAGTFADRDAAARACVALKAQGKDCMVVAAAR